MNKIKEKLSPIRVKLFLTLSIVVLIIILFLIIVNTFVLEPFYFHEVSDKKAYETEEKLKEICRYMNERNIIVDTFMSELKKEKAKILTKG